MTQPSHRRPSIEREKAIVWAYWLLVLAIIGARVAFPAAAPA